jgi:glutathione S-transferase
MKLYYHPASTTSRPLMLFAAENGIKMDMQVVDLFTGEHYQPPFAEGINPNRQVPVLEDDGFRLTESATILKYLAVKTKSPLYPEGLKERARVNERIDWINTQLNRDLCYGLVYPQAFPHHKRPSDEHQKGTLSWAKERAAGWLKVLDDHIIGKNEYLCGNQITLADYYGASFVATSSIIGSDLAAYPNIKRWLGNMKKLKSWAKTWEVVDGFAGSLKGPFEKV